MAKLVNLNTAYKETLTTLPKIGPAIAERIIAARPFEMANDLKNITGIGPAMLEQLMPLVTITLDESPSVEAESVDETEPSPTDDTVPDEGETDSPDEATVSEAEEPDSTEADSSQPQDTISDISILPFANNKKTSEANYVTSKRALLMIVTSIFFTLILAVALSLGIIAGINGGLRFVRPEQALELNRQIESVSERVDVLSQDVEGLRTRMTNIETVGDRVDQLDEDIAGVAEQAEALSTEVETLRSASDHFQGFLDGLRELLDAIVESETP
ncbi:MAG: helix-hairpin-helix domain-containing protein [Chloroflexota bacterium]|nr:helix-hairpin-helix domain-containing protein [Chloroflexota bacterium]